MKQEKNECCPKFDPKKWDEKSFDWDNKQFIMESIPTFFHIPIPSTIGKKIMKMWKLAEGAGKVNEDLTDSLVLFTDPSAFKSEIYFMVTGDVPGANNVSLSGNFQSKVFDGGYNTVPKFIKLMNKYLADRDMKADKYYIHYAYCPKCAKEEGHNYMILFARV